MVGVMYAGKIVELGDVHTIFESPRHPYTVGLMESLPKLNADDDWLRPIPGQPPSLITDPRLPLPPAVLPLARPPPLPEEEPPLRPIGGSAHLTACHFAEELKGHTVRRPWAQGSELSEAVVTERATRRAEGARSSASSSSSTSRSPAESSSDASARFMQHQSLICVQGRRSAWSANPVAARPRSAGP